jgi:hypothetical protein
MTSKVHTRGPNRITLDSTPLVGPDGDYCRTVGFTDGRLFCAVRPEGNPERVACEAYGVGRAEDTGKYGPTWTRNGQYCTGDLCENDPDNQYMLWAYSSGTYEACTESGVCVSLQVVW